MSNTQGVGHRGHEAGGAPAGAAGGPAVRRRGGFRADLEGGWGPGRAGTASSITQGLRLMQLSHPVKWTSASCPGHWVNMR